MHVGRTEIKLATYSREKQQNQTYETILITVKFVPDTVDNMEAEGELFHKLDNLGIAAFPFRLSTFPFKNHILVHIFILTPRSISPLTPQ